MEAPQTSHVVEAWIARAEVSPANHELPLKRRHPRYLTNDHFVIRPLLDDFPETSAKGHNLSPDGLGVICRQPIPRDYYVLLRLDELDQDHAWIQATVIHCTQTLGGYKVGLQFREE